MEFTNEIFFNKKLIQNETVLITYSGKLYKEYSAEISIVFGFGENWDYTQEVKMQEKENGFEAAITLKNYDTFNFCFKNNYNIWDNNSGFNYIAKIEPAKDEINENQATFESQSEKSEETKEEFLNDAQVITEEQKQAAIEEAFNNLLNSIMDFKEEDINKNVNLENGFGLQSVDEIKETDFTSCDDIFNELFNDLANSESSEKTNIQNIEKEENVQENSDSQLEELLNNYNEKKKKKNKIITSKELDELMDNILNSIIEESQSEQENINQAEINQETKENNFEISGLPAKKHSSSVEDFIDKCIDGTYFFFKNIWNSCKKVGVLIKTKTHELLGEDK